MYCNHSSRCVNIHIHINYPSNRRSHVVFPKVMNYNAYVQRHHPFATNDPTLATMDTERLRINIRGTTRSSAISLTRIESRDFYVYTQQEALDHLSAVESAHATEEEFWMNKKMSDVRSDDVVADVQSDSDAILDAQENTPQNDVSAPGIPDDSVENLVTRDIGAPSLTPVRENVETEDSETNITSNIVPTQKSTPPAGESFVNNNPCPRISSIRRTARLRSRTYIPRISSYS